MARRTYHRDARGRFASGGNSAGGRNNSPQRGPSTGRRKLQQARRSVRQARSKLAAFDPADQSIKSTLSRRAQRGAITKAEKRLKAAAKAAIIRAPRQAGVISKARRRAAAPKASPVTATGKPVATIVPFRRRPAAPTGKPVAKIVPFRRRQQPQAATNVIQPSPRRKGLILDAENTRAMARLQAQALADRLRGGTDAEIAGITLRNLGGRLGAQLIQQRARRAAKLAAGGSKVAARALKLYDQQLAFLPVVKEPRNARTKAARAAVSTIVPGPRNPNQPPKPPKRSRKGRKK